MASAPQQKTLAELYAYWCGDGYELINNLWGKDAATSGSQCTYLDDACGTSVQWHTTWTWHGAPNNVKSYPYAGRQFPRGRKISSISSMPTSATWRYDNENIRANVAYDVFTAEDPNHANSGGDYELMIWLGKYGGVCPIGSPVCSVALAGRTWDLWVGFNGRMKVYSFVPPSGGIIRSFSGDVKEFFNYLQANHKFPASSQNLIGTLILFSPSPYPD